ncbi:MAG: hypothetical protein QNJ55_08230, partial [Xenococcus sp. MO_188.B8]|nr:hypothetical protein [Xenococcus sp. MO_188.B8]
PDGTILASGSFDRTIKLWNVETGQEIRTLQGHDGSVWSVSFSPDGTILASGSSDDTIKLWNVETGQEIRTLQRHDGSVFSVSFSPDGTILASGSFDRTIKLWNVETGQEIRTLQGHDSNVYSVSFSPDGTILASGSFDRTIKLWYKGGKQIDDSVTLEDSTLSYNNSNFWSPVTKYTFRRLTTSTVQTLSNKMFIGGLDHLLTLDSQLTPELNFDRFSPTDNVIPPESNTLDFDGSLGLYFWEIFFHIPFLVANTLNSNQRFEEAQKWYHYIFNPTTQNNEKGLVGYWPMNEFNENEAGEKVVIPDRVGNNNGTLKGDAKLETVNENDFPVTDSKNVLKLDGNGDYVTLSAANQLGLTNNSFTAEAWINIAEFPESSDLTILGIDQTSKNKGLHLVIRRQKPYMGFFSNDTTGKTVLKTGEWYHLAWRYDDSKQEQAIFVNGQLDISRTGKSPFQGTGTVNIGRWRSGTYFNGQIAEVRIWNVALSAEQILDEVGRHTSDRFWRYLPFRGNILQLQKLQKILSNDDAIKAYNDNPFDPHAIARLRIGAYEKAIVMKYIDNLLDWGDQLFAQDNRESINQATLLYFLAYDLLGEEPENLGKMRSPAPKTFQQIKDKYEDIPQFLIDLENQLSDSSITAIASTPFNDLNTYFCAPENEQFIAYWERVQDRLYKIRHSLSIEGIRRQLALFQPAIDPAQLVRAVAGGQMPLSVVSQLSATVPNYRFDYMLERAKNITSTLIQLGSSLLSALEKKDAEELALLRSSHERTILEMIKTTKEKQIEEAEETKLSLEESKNSAKERNGTYEEWIAADLSDRETKNLEAMKKAENYDSEAGIANKNAAISYAIPQLGSPFAITFGGQQFGAIDGVKGVRKQSKASESTFQAQEFQVREGYDRRKQEWELQRDLSKIDIQQIDKQIKAQEIRKAIAEQELETHKKSIEQAKEIEDFLKGKFTNQELYQWMIGRLSILYFQTYKVALDMAMATQSAYQYELNKDDTYINFDYWDSLKKGLLAGESLMLGLNQLEKAYIEGNVRRLEIEKTISLLQLDPLAFQQLKDTGKCEFELSEKLFDFDFPGHYCRQTKTIAISIPAVVGPYQNISATLTQTSNKTLLKPNVNAVKYLLGEGDPPEDSVLRVNWRRNQKIALSRGAMDNGLFELNFRDERYLPFEGTGAISEWELSLPKAANRIDFDTISDVIITLSYTALDGGDNFRQQVTSLPPLTTYSEAYYFNLKQAFPGEWHTFINSNTDTNSQKLNFHISEEIIPPHIEDAKLMEIIFKLDAPDASSPMSFATIKIGENNIINSNDNSINEKVAGNWFGDWVIDFDLTKVPDSLKKDGFLNPEIVNNIELILIYEGEINWGN